MAPNNFYIDWCEKSRGYAKPFPLPDMRDLLCMKKKNKKKES